MDRSGPLPSWCSVTCLPSRTRPVRNRSRASCSSAVKPICDSNQSSIIE